MKLITTCMTLLLAVFLTGCETLTPAECATANWRQLGQLDGSRGEPDRAAQFFESCSKVKIGVDVDSYRRGRAEGLQSYCSLGNAIAEGQAGRPYAGVCPMPMNQSFKNVHGVALREFSARKNMERLEDVQQQLQNELGDRKTADDRKVRIRELLTRSDRDMRNAREELRFSQFELDRMANDLRLRRLY